MKLLIIFFSIVVVIFLGYRACLKMTLVSRATKFFVDYEKVVKQYNFFYSIATSNDFKVADEYVDIIGVAKSEIKGVYLEVITISLKEVKIKSDVLIGIYEKDFKPIGVYKMDCMADDLRRIVVNINQWLLSNE